MPKKSLANQSAVSKTIYDELFPKKLTKSDKRKMEIIEGAIRAYSGVDFSSVSFDDIALPAKTSRRLVQHYFPEKSDLFETSMRVIRAQFQVLAVEALSKADTPLEQFEEYVRSTFYWVKAQPLHIRSWLLFFLVCSQKSKFKNMHVELTGMGEERIISLIQNMKPGTRLSLSKLHFFAKTIQRLITGGVMEICSERPIEEIEVVKEEVLKACLAILN